MTLPFRRRHHDDETGHDRARALTSSEMVEPLAADDAAWLSGHLEICPECRQEREAFLADRLLLRALRDDAPIPPRDLWARTSAALDREARHRPRRGAARGATAGGRARGRSGVPGLPFGAIAGAMIVLVVVGVSVLPRISPPVSPTGPTGTLTAENTLGPQPTTFAITPSRIAWIQAADDGNWELVFANVDEVCPRDQPRCERLGEENQARPINLGDAPTSVTISPTEKQLLVESPGDGTTPDRIFVVALAPEPPGRTPSPTVTAPPATASDQPATPEPATPEPGSPEPGSPEPSATMGAGAIEIASGVTLVGEAAYSSDGRWLAFSAQPSDGSTGPDLYIWTPGQTTAVAVTSDHATYFSTWLGGKVLASRVETVTTSPDSTESPAPSAEATPDATADPNPSPEAPQEAHPVSFVLDPATLVSTDIAQQDVWLPVVDPTGRFAAYWSGTVLPVVGGTGWQLGTGELVLSGWSDGPGAEASPQPSADATTDPQATPALVEAIGPTGARFAVATGPMAEFKAKFDPSGTRLAVWVGEQLNADVGRLHLVVLDRTAGTIDAGPQPLPGAPALRRFSIDNGRLAWVSPSGQDGEESSVQVLGWSEHEFGEIRTNAARDLYIVR